jgi:hypothetical protein
VALEAAGNLVVPPPSSFDVTGTTGNDTIDSSYGGRTASNGETIGGLEGDDVIHGEGGADGIWGGDGNDTVAFDNATQAVNASLATNQTTATGDGWGNQDTFNSIENLRGSTGFGDTLTGDSNSNTLEGLGGADTLTGGTGVDTIDGGADNDTINLANGDFASGESITGGAGTDEVVLTDATVINFTTGTLATLETLTGSASDDTVTMTATNFGMFSTINLAGGTADVLNVEANGDISAGSAPTVSNVETGNLTGTAGNDTTTMTGAQLNAILIGTGTIDTGAGTDTLNITSTSTDLNALADGSITNLETISASTAGAGVTINLSSQTEGFTITGGGSADTITGSTGADTIDAGGGGDIINLANGEFAAGESITGGAGIDSITLTNATTVDFTTGTLATLETLTGSTGNDTVTMNAAHLDMFTAANMGAGAADILNIVADGSDISAATLGTISNAETGNLTGTGASTSIDLNLLGVIDASITGVTTISASGAVTGVTIDMSAQTDTMTITGSSSADTLDGGTRISTLNGGGGGDTINSNSVEVLNDVDLINNNFDATTEDFTYTDGGGAWGGTDPVNADVAGTRSTTDGNTANGSLEIYIDGVSNATSTNISGSWDASITPTDDMVGVQITFAYRHFAQADLDLGDDTEVYIDFNGTIYDDLGGNSFISQTLGANGGGANDDTGWVTVTVDLPDLTASTTYSLSIGILQTAENSGNEDSYLRIDDLILDGDVYDTTAITTLNGQDGDDQLYGSTGIDHFLFEATSAFNDVDDIYSFDTTDSLVGDAIDIKDLLTGYDAVDDITEWVQITDDGTDSTIAIDADGTVGGTSYTSIAVIHGVTGLTDEVALEASGNLITL